MVKDMIISFDMACTLFWEHGCDPRCPHRPVKDIFREMMDILEKRGYSVADGESSWRMYKEIWDAVLERGPSRELWHRYLLLKLLYRIGARINHVELDELYEWFIEKRARLFHIPPRYKRLLEYLRGHGYQIILTTATGAHDLPLKILEYNGVSEYFSMVFSTQLLGIPKRDPRFYEEIADTLGVEPRNIVHIGDSLESDVLSPRRAGFKTIYYGWRTMCRASDPDPCVTDLWDIVGYLL